MTFGGSTGAVMDVDCLSDIDVRPSRRPSTGVTRDLLSQPGAQKSKLYTLPTGAFEVSFGDELPPWFDTTMGSLLEILALGPGWDGHAAPPIHPRIAQDALKLLCSVMDHRTPPPSIVPTYRGFLQMEWHRNGIDLEIEILGGHRIHLWFEDQATGREVDRELTTDLSQLTECVSELSSRQ